MNYEIIELENLSGRKTTIYSVLIEDDERTLFEHFIQQNNTDNYSEVKQIVNRVHEIGHRTGARAIFFKEGEGKPGDGVCALYDDEESKLRLYCIRFGSVAVILGGGGPKPPGIRTWQEDFQLRTEAERMIWVARDIMKRIKDGDLYWSPDGTRLEGNLKSSDNEE